MTKQTGDEQAAEFLKAKGSQTADATQPAAKQAAEVAARQVLEDGLQVRDARLVAVDSQRSTLVGRVAHQLADHAGDDPIHRGKCTVGTCGQPRRPVLSPPNLKDFQNVLPT